MPFEAASRGLFDGQIDALKTWTAPVPSPLEELRLVRGKVHGKRRITGESGEERGTEAESEGAEKEERVRVRLKRPEERKMRGKTADLMVKSTPSFSKTIKLSSDFKPKLPFRAGASTRVFSPKPVLAKQPFIPTFQASPRLKQSLHLPVKAASGLLGGERHAENRVETLKRGPIELRSGLRSAKRSMEHSQEGGEGLGISGYTPKSALIASADWEDLTDLLPRSRIPMQTPRPNNFPI